MVLLRDWNSYLKSLYEFPNDMDTIPIVPLEDEVFSLDEIEFEVKRLANGKAKDILGYQAKNIKIKEPILIPHIHNLFNLASTRASLNPRCKASLFISLKIGIETFPRIKGP
jgi:hypothetical protein